MKRVSRPARIPLRDTSMYASPSARAPTRPMTAEVAIRALESTSAAAATVRGPSRKSLTARTVPTGDVIEEIAERTPPTTGA